MNLITAKRTKMKIAAKGQPLGRVGVFIVVGFIGLLCATAALSVNAATSNSDLEITANNGRLSATLQGNQSDQNAASWSWFALVTTESAAFNNSSQLSDICQNAADNLAASTTGEASMSGSGSSVSLTQPSLGKLYCFKALVATDDGAESASYGGYVVRSVDLE